MKCYVQWNPVYGRKDYLLKRVLIPVPLAQQIGAQPTVARILVLGCSKLNKVFGMNTDK